MNMKKVFYLLVSCVFIVACNNKERKENASVKENNNYNKLIEQGSEAFQNNEIEKAIDMFTQAIALDNAKTIGYYRLGVAQAMFCNQGKEDYCKGSLKNFERVIEYDPNFERVNYNMGIVYFNEKKFDEALIYFEKAISKDSSDVDYYINRGLTKLNLKDTLGSCSDFKKAQMLGDEQSGDYISLYCKL